MYSIRVPFYNLASSPQQPQGYTMHLTERNRLDSMDHTTAATILHKEHHNNYSNVSQALIIAIRICEKSR